MNTRRTENCTDMLSCNFIRFWYAMDIKCRGLEASVQQLSLQWCQNWLPLAPQKFHIPFPFRLPFPFLSFEFCPFPFNIWKFQFPFFSISSWPGFFMPLRVATLKKKFPTCLAIAWRFFFFVLCHSASSRDSILFHRQGPAQESPEGLEKDGLWQRAEITSRQTGDSQGYERDVRECWNCQLVSVTQLELFARYACFSWTQFTPLHAFFSLASCS